MIKFKQKELKDCDHNINLLINSRFENILNDQNAFLSSLKDVEYVKNDTKIDCGIVTINQKKFFIKIFHYVNTVHLLYHRICASRAQHLWEISKILINNRIRIPEPVLFYDDFFNKKSCYISDYIEESVNLGTFAKNNKSSELTNIIEKLSDSIVDLHVKGFSHGDFKWSNILISKQKKIYFVDLDNTTFSKILNMKKIEVDYIRFYRFALEISCDKLVDETLFPLILKDNSNKILDGDFFCKITKRARKEWQKSGYRTL